MFYCQSDVILAGVCQSYAYIKKKVFALSGDMSVLYNGLDIFL